MDIGRQVEAGEQVIDFWFDLASPYSYLSAARILLLDAPLANAICWRPMLLGAIFKAQGWESSPFNAQDAKRKHMWRDVERRGAALGLSIRPPNEFPRNSLRAARVMVLGAQEPWGRKYAMEVFEAEFGLGLDIAEDGVLAKCIAKAGQVPSDVLATAAADVVKQRLRDQTSRAVAAGVFGAPTFIVGDELFWGDDRLAEALTWRSGDHPVQTANTAVRRSQHPI